MKRTSTLTVIRAVGWVTFLEIFRDKILYNILVVAFLLFGVGYLASRLTFVQPERVVLDFGISAVAISCAMIAAFTGASILIKEYDRRTVYVALAHPISKAQFVFGKFGGLALVLFINWILLSLSFVGILLATGGSLGTGFPKTLFFGLFLSLVQSLLLASIALFFSTFSTTSLSVIFTVGFYLIGSNISHLRLMASKAQSSLGAFGLNSASLLFPNFENFSLGTKVTYNLPVPTEYFATSVLYGLVVTLIYIWAAGLLSHGRQV